MNPLPIYIDTHRQIDIDIERYRDIQRDTETERDTDRQTDRQTDSGTRSASL